jgi:hypothetical protein
MYLVNQGRPVNSSEPQILNWGGGVVARCIRCTPAYSSIRSSGPTDLVGFWNYFRHNFTKMDPQDLNTRYNDASRNFVQSAIKISL